MSRPRPRARRRPMISWISSTAIGSIPTNGSSSSRNDGWRDSARVISTRRRSPPGGLWGGRVGGGGGVSEVRGVQVGEQLLEPLLALGAGEMHRLEHREDVLAHRELAEDARLLSEVAEAPAGAAVDRQLGDVLLVEPDGSGVRPQEPDDHVERGALARAVGPEQAHDLAAPDAQRDALHDPELAVVAHEPHRHEAVRGDLGSERQLFERARPPGRPGFGGTIWAAPGFAGTSCPAPGCTVARTWCWNSKCWRLGSLSKPTPSRTEPSFSTRTSLSDLIRRWLFKKWSSSVLILQPSTVWSTTSPRAIMSRVRW